MLDDVPRVGPYDLLLRLDAGDSAPLFLARSAASPDLMRMLRIRPRRDLPTEPEYAERFEARALLASRLSHPGLLRTIDAGIDAERAWVAYEPAYGVALPHLLKHQVRVPLRLLVRFGVGLIDSLEYLRQVELSPHAITPDRFLATYDGRLLWTDCGLEEYSLVAPSTQQRNSYHPPDASDRTSAPQQSYALGKVFAQLALIACSESEKVDTRNMPLRITEAVRWMTHKDPAQRSLSEARQELVDFSNEDGRPTDAETRYLIHRCRRQYSLLCSVLDHEDRPTSSPMARGEGPVAGSSPGGEVGGYRLHRTIGGSKEVPLWEAEGPDGSVWLRTRTAPPTEDFGPEELVRDLERERTVVAQLDAASLPTVLEARLDAEIPYLAYRAEPCTPLLRSVGSFEPERIASIGYWLAEALAEMHERGIIFGNLQPRAIRLRPNGQPLLLDLSSVHCRSRPPDSLWQNLLALAPETLTEGLYDEASERFALGALLYQLVCGTRPFRGLDDAELAKRIQDRDPLPLAALVPSIPPAWDDLILGLLDKEPRARPSLAEVRHRLGPETVDLASVPASHASVDIPTPFDLFDEYSETSTGH